MVVWWMHAFNNIFDLLYYVIGDDPLDTCWKVLMHHIMSIKKIREINFLLNLYGDISINGVGLQIFTYGQHLWPLSSEGSLVCHTYCDTGHPFIIVIFKDLWHSQLLPSVWQWSCHYLFYELSLSRLGFKHPIFHLLWEHCYWLRHCRCWLAL